MKEREVSKVVNQYVDFVEESNVITTISDSETAPIVVELLQNSSFVFTLTPRVRSIKSNESISFTLRAMYDKSLLGFSITIGLQLIDMYDINGNVSKVIPITLSSNHKQSDRFLRFLIKSWNIEKTGKPRMKQEVYMYTERLQGANDDHEKYVKFIGYFGIIERAQLEPSLTIEIDWNNGLAKIYETSIIERELIINRLMM